MALTNEKKKIGVLGQAREWLDRLATSNGKLSSREQALLWNYHLDAQMERLSRDELKTLFHGLTGQDLEVEAREVPVNFVDGYGNRDIPSPDPLVGITDPQKRAALQASMREIPWTGWKGRLARRLGMEPQKRSINIAEYNRLLGRG